MVLETGIDERDVGTAHICFRKMLLSSVVAFESLFPKIVVQVLLPSKSNRAKPVSAHPETDVHFTKLWHKLKDTLLDKMCQACSDKSRGAEDYNYCSNSEGRRSELIVIASG